MRFLLSIIIIAIASFFAGLYFPWWSIAIIAFAVAFVLPQSPAASFITGFLGVFALWVILAAFINSSNAGILATRIGNLLKVGGAPSIVILVTGFVGGIVSGLAALSASFLFKSKQRQK
ncbi:MAG: hypothetical protein ACK5NK_00190 [Niabella sp.]